MSRYYRRTLNEGGGKIIKKMFEELSMVTVPWSDAPRDRIPIVLLAIRPVSCISEKKRGSLLFFYPIRSSLYKGLPTIIHG